MLKSKSVLTLFLIFFLCFCGISCSTKAKSQSALSHFEMVDALISQGQNKDAIKELKKLSKTVYDSWSYIGLYKRYNLLGEKNLAEKILTKGLKANSKNPELCAVYSKFLLEQERLAEAEKVSENLKNTRYASIYSECVFKNHISEIAGAEPSSLYTDSKYYDLFWESYQTSKNPVWIRNCASTFLSSGKYSSASELTPQAFSDCDDSYFWALVNYDAGNFVSALNAAEYSLYFFESMGKKASKKTSEITVTALMSDAYNFLADSQNSHNSREKIVTRFVTGLESVENLSSSEKSILPIIVVNSALENKKLGNGNEAASLLTYLVMTFPDFVPGLTSYANFAYESNLGRREDDEILALRRAGLQTLEMERYDSRAKIPLSDALYRIDLALKNISDPYLYITKLDLRYKSDSSLNIKDKTSDLWKLLEESSSEAKKYHDVLVQYTVVFLLENGMTDDAEMIFNKYLVSKYGFAGKNSIYEQITDIARTADIKDLELCAYFTLIHNEADLALRLYEYCVFESAGKREFDISPKVSSNTGLNLGNLYYGLALKDKALDTYGKVAGRETDKKIRSEAFYRIASIYFALDDAQNALRACDYACSINPENAKAHLLKTKITKK